MPATRWLVALGCAALLLAACGQADAGPLIGVRPQTVPSPVPVSRLDTTSIEAAFASQLVDLNSIPAIGEDALANGLLPIESILTFRQSLRLAQLQTLGQAYLTDRLNAISALRSQVYRDQSLSGYQKANVTALLDNATALVNQLRLKIAEDQLVDQAKPDVVRIGTLRVYGLLLPQARLLMAGYNLGQLAALYGSQVASLQIHVDNAQSLGCNVTTAQAYVNDLSAQSSALRYDSNAILSDVQSLNAAGYPGNKYLLKSAHGPQQAGKYAIYRAGTDANGAHNAIAALHALGC